MKLPIYRYIFGFYRVTAEDRDFTRLQNLIFTERIVAYLQKDRSFLIPRSQKTRLLQAGKAAHLSLTVSELLGLPRLLQRYRHRIGIPIGVLLGVAVLVWGTHTVWRVEVSGSSRLSQSVEENLSALGFGVGSRIPQENYDEIIAAYRLAHPEVAWMGIYTEGTTARVRIIEKESHAEEDSLSNTPSHLVADCDALIVRMEIKEGTAVTRIGDVVKKGEVLALGYMKGAHADRIFAAKGAVIGRVSETITVEIPYVQTEKVETDRRKTQISLIFLKKRINFFKKNNKNAEDYVIIEKKNLFTLPGGIVLPFGFCYTEAICYEEKDVEPAREEIERQGMEQLNAEIKKTVGDGELLFRRVWSEEKDGAYVLHATVDYTRNIAASMPFTVN